MLANGARARRRQFCAQARHQPSSLRGKIAMGYRGYGLPIAEVISEGNVGLMQAVKRFEPDKGFRLATYAMWWIKAAIQEYILRSWSLVKMGTTANQKKLFFNLRKARRARFPRSTKATWPDQVKLIAKRLGVTEQDVIDEPPAWRRCVAQRADPRGRRSGEWMDWLVDDSASARRAGSPNPSSRITATRRFGRSAHGASTIASAGYLKHAAHQPRTLRNCRGVQRVPRAYPPDRSARLREGAESGTASVRSYAMPAADLNPAPASWVAALSMSSTDGKCYVVDA